MRSTLTEPLSAALHELLTARGLTERTKEIALALVTDANRGRVNQLTRHWTGAGPHGPAVPEDLRLTCESVLADADRAALRLTARSGHAVWTLHAELRLDTAGRVAEYHDVLEPWRPATGRL